MHYSWESFPQTTHFWCSSDIWEKIIFPSVVYHYKDLNQLIKDKLEIGSHPKKRISLISDGSSFRVRIELELRRVGLGRVALSRVELRWVGLGWVG